MLTWDSSVAGGPEDCYAEVSLHRCSRFVCSEPATRVEVLEPPVPVEKLRCSSEHPEWCTDGAELEDVQNYVKPSPEGPDLVCRRSPRYLGKDGMRCSPDGQSR